MRVVGGQARGRPLRSPAGRGTRPTSDRVREAIFSVLGSLTTLDGATVVDLFAGSGALGVEALSRGAARAAFIDRDRGAVAAVRANVSVVGAGPDAVRVVRGDAVALAGEAAGADVVFADPPYAFTDWGQLLTALANSGFRGLAVLESDRQIELESPWEAVRVKRYGSTVVTVARPAVVSAAGPDDLDPVQGVQ